MTKLLISECETHTTMIPNMIILRNNVGVYIEYLRNISFTIFFILIKMNADWQNVQVTTVGFISGMNIIIYS